MIPDELIDRRKQGFGVPVYEWLFDKLGQKARTELDSFCHETDFLNHKAVSATLDQGGARGWYLLNLAMWWKEYIA